METAIRTVYRTGGVVIGLSEVKKGLMLGKLKAIIYSISLPDEEARELETLVKMADIPIKMVELNSLDLGSLCNKPFPVAVLGIKEFGQSDLGALIKK